MKKVAALLAAAAAVLALAGPADAAGLQFERCGSYGAQCARLSVPLDRTGDRAGRVSLHIRRVRARGRATLPPLVVLAGGPGQSATAAFGGEALAVFYGAYRNRDLIIFDQRGTGRSGVLRCPSMERANILAAGDAAAACARRLGSRRAFYTSRDSVEDIDAIRRALGARRLALFGTSYGTKVALGYALGHPDRVERLVLDSVVEAGGPEALYLDTLAAVPRAIGAVCGSRCRSFTDDPVADITALVTRMASGPLRGVSVDARGRRSTRAVDRADLFAVLLAGDFDPRLRAAFPAAVRSALDGDLASLVRLRRQAYALESLPPSPRLVSAGLYAAATCEEVRLPWPRTTAPLSGRRRALAATAAAALPALAFRPFDRGTALATDILDLCRRWRAAPIAPDFGPGPLPDVPVLLMEGEDDLRTPVENAQRVAAQFPQAALLVAPRTGHSALGSSLGSCLIRGFTRFLQAERVRSRRCPAPQRTYPALAPAPRRLTDVDPLEGTRGRRGRALGALAQTLRDVADDALANLRIVLNGDLARGGGLRAGRYRVDGDGDLHLRKVAYVPGVRVSGTVEGAGERRQRGRLRISGPGTPEGRLVLRGGRLRGVVGGRRISARLGSGRADVAARAASAHLPHEPFG